MISASGSPCVAFLSNPTDPNAGTNRTNAVSRDNLMNGASLGYDGSYRTASLDNVGLYGFWWSSTIRAIDRSYHLIVSLEISEIHPQGANNKHVGRSVRCLLSPLEALVQDLIHCRMYILATITGLRVGFTTSRCMATTGRLV